MIKSNKCSLTTNCFAVFNQWKWKNIQTMSWKPCFLQKSFGAILEFDNQWHAFLSFTTPSSASSSSTLRHSVWKPPKMSHLTFSILAFSTNFCPIKSDLSGNTIWQQASGFQKFARLSIFGILFYVMSTQNVNVARFASNVLNETFSVIFKLDSKKCCLDHYR